MNHQPTNYLIIDVEDYFQVSAFEDIVGMAKWDNYTPRVVENTRKILTLLDTHNVKGVNDGVNDLFDLIRLNPGKKTKDFIVSLGQPRRTLERWLRQLKDQGKIKFHGASKTGGYFAENET